MRNTTLSHTLIQKIQSNPIYPQIIFLLRTNGSGKSTMNYYCIGYFLSTETVNINTARVHQRVLAGDHHIPTKLIKKHYKTILQQLHFAYTHSTWKCEVCKAVKFILV